ncbi:hypothetical protein SADUNF_Sadunf18G0046500 [Salix dunnii]|uniref:Microsomal signal peptidase 22 kDa subunit n=1 Tax=Salix dunnii TaxID=1413687 RepID=A0A835J4B3_9ROSI|nr:hypothetical protein SADUNF_Sadunf18G0046500 [Salix dunnii]
MHSSGYRTNALLTFAITILALMCVIASFSDNFNFPSPSTEIQIMKFNWFRKQTHGNDEVSLTMNITADLQSLFTWNTKEVHNLKYSKSLTHAKASHRWLFHECNLCTAEYETPKNSLNQCFTTTEILA